LRIADEERSFYRYVWSFVGGRPIVNHRSGHDDILAKTAESDALSKDLKKRGFRFVGSTICYAFMQATGMVNDHVVDCFRYLEVSDELAGREANAGVMRSGPTGM